MNLVSEHRLRNDPAETRQLAAWVDAFARRTRLSEAARYAVDLALEECVANVISYAWDDQREHWMILRFKTDAGQTRIEVEIEDDGRAFNPLTAPPVDTTEPLESRPIGGLGIHMVRRLMDAVEYRRENGRNILTLTKRTTPASHP